MTELDMAWVAGIFDGEGCIAIYLLKSQSGQHFMRASVQMSHRPTLERIASIVGGAVYASKLKKSSPAYYKTMYGWQLDGRDAGQFLEKIRPYVTTKAHEIDIALEALENWGFMSPSEKHKGLSQEVIETREHYRLQLKEAKAA